MQGWQNRGQGWVWGVSLGIMLGLVSSLLAGCQGRNPASIWLERRNLPTPVMPVFVRKARPEQAQERPGEPAPPPSAFAKPGVQVPPNNNDKFPGLKKLDMQALVAQGKAQFQANDADVQNGVLEVFDNNVTSLVRSNQVNPVAMELAFAEPIKVKSVRLFPSHGAQFRWQVSTNKETPGLETVLDEEGAWSRIDLPDASPTQYLRVLLLRSKGDNYVHLGEMEVYTQP